MGRLLHYHNYHQLQWGHIKSISFNMRNVPSDMCTQWTLKSACASAQSFQSLPCPPQEILYPSLSKMCTVKILIRLRECAGWSKFESTLSPDAGRYFFDVITPIKVNAIGYKEHIKERKSQSYMSYKLWTIFSYHSAFPASILVKSI